MLKGGEEDDEEKGESLPASHALQAAADDEQEDDDDDDDDDELESREVLDELDKILEGADEGSSVTSQSPDVAITLQEDLEEEEEEQGELQLEQEEAGLKRREQEMVEVRRGEEPEDQEGVEPTTRHPTVKMMEKEEVDLVGEDRGEKQQDGVGSEGKPLELKEEDLPPRPTLFPSRSDDLESPAPTSLLAASGSEEPPTPSPHPPVLVTMEVEGPPPTQQEAELEPRPPDGPVGPPVVMDLPSPLPPDESQGPHVQLTQQPPPSQDKQELQSHDQQVATDPQTSHDQPQADAGVVGDGSMDSPDAKISPDQVVKQTSTEGSNDSILDQDNSITQQEQDRYMYVRTYVHMLCT